MTGFVKIMARAEGRSLDMVAPEHAALDALWALAIELPPTFEWSAAPVVSIDVHAESQTT